MGGDCLPGFCEGRNRYSGAAIYPLPKRALGGHGPEKHCPNPALENNLQHRGKDPSGLSL
jgi:hypothetical protein